MLDLHPLSTSHGRAGARSTVELPSDSRFRAQGIWGCWFRVDGLYGVPSRSMHHFIFSILTCRLLLS